MLKRKYKTIIVQREKIDFSTLAALLAEKIRKGALNNASDHKKTA